MNKFSVDVQTIICKYLHRYNLTQVHDQFLKSYAEYIYLIEAQCTSQRNGNVVRFDFYRTPRIRTCKHCKKFFMYPMFSNKHCYFCCVKLEKRQRQYDKLAQIFGWVGLSIWIVGMSITKLKDICAVGCGLSLITGISLAYLGVPSY